MSVLNGLCASCNQIYKALWAKCTCTRVMCTHTHTHTHTPLEKRASTERLTLKLVPRPQRGNAGRKVPWMQKGCALTSPPFFLTSFLFPPSISPDHLLPAVIACGRRPGIVKLNQLLSPTEKQASLQGSDMFLPDISVLSLRNKRFPGCSCFDLWGHQSCTVFTFCRQGVYVLP